MDQVEKYIMTRLYKSVFCPETTDDEKKDLATQKRIRWASLHSKWAVTVEQYTYSDWTQLHFVSNHSLLVAALCSVEA